MSFLDNIVSFGKSVGTFLKSDGIGSQLAKVAITGLALNQVLKSVNKQNSLPDAANTSRPDTTTREQLLPSVENSIPVVYGNAFVKGIISDAVMVDQKFMWYCVTICENTGVKISDTQQSSISLNKVFINKSEVLFQPDGITVSAFADPEGNVVNDPNNLIKIYFYSKGSSSPKAIGSFSQSNQQPAPNIMPGWTSQHLMTNLAFVLVRVEYNKEKNVTSLGDIEFNIENTMTLPGDCVYDYLTNARYGAGIKPEEVFIQ